MAAMEEGCNIISGVGDEVVLFVFFLLASTVLIIYLSRKRQSSSRVVNNLQMVNNDMSRHIPTVNEPLIVDDAIRHRSTIPATNTATTGDDAIPVRITIKLLTLQNTQNVTVDERTTLQQLQQNHFPNEVQEGRTIHFIYQGHVLHDINSSLSDNGITHNSTVHVHIGSLNQGQEAQQSQTNFGDANHPMLDLSFLFLPLIGLMLGIVWMSFLIWPYMFSFLTKFMLFLLSIGYVYMAYSMNL